MSAEENLKKLNLELPPAPKPAGVYKPIVTIGNLAYLSGHGPLKPDGSMFIGRLGEDMDVEAGYAAARQVGLALLSTIKANLGSLDRVKRVVKVLGLVRCTDEFDQQPAVVNGFSELFRDVFGEECGVGARSAMGTNALPSGIAVEIEVILEIEA